MALLFHVLAFVAVALVVLVIVVAVAVSSPDGVTAPDGVTKRAPKTRWHTLAICCCLFVPLLLISPGGGVDGVGGVGGVVGAASRRAVVC